MSRRATLDDIPPSGLSANVAAAPTAAGVLVTIAALDGGAERHLCIGWPARPDDATPARGHGCLVVVDELDRYWITSWEMR